MIDLNVLKIGSVCEKLVNLIQDGGVLKMAAPSVKLRLLEILHES